MDKIKDVTSQVVNELQVLSEQKATTKPSPNLLQMEKYSNFLGRFAKLFGERWKLRTMKDDRRTPTDEFLSWIEQIQDLSTDQVGQGWAAVKERFEQRLLADEPNFPPNEHEFRILCTKKQGRWEHNTAAYKITDPERLLGDETEADRLEREAKADKARIKAMEIIRGQDESS